VTHTHTASGLQTINFTTPYLWDGVSNIVLDVRMSGANSSNNAQAYYTVAPGTVLYTTSNLTPTTGTSSANRPNVIFTGTAATPTLVSWSDGTNTVGSGASLTFNPSSTATYTATITASGCTIQTNGVGVTVNPIPTAPVGTDSAH